MRLCIVLAAALLLTACPRASDDDDDDDDAVEEPCEGAVKTYDDGLVIRLDYDSQGRISLRAYETSPSDITLTDFEYDDGQLVGADNGDYEWTLEYDGDRLDVVERTGDALIVYDYLWDDGRLEEIDVDSYTDRVEVLTYEKGLLSSYESNQAGNPTDHFRWEGGCAVEITSSTGTISFEYDDQGREVGGSSPDYSWTVEHEGVSGCTVDRVEWPEFPGVPGDQADKVRGPLMACL